MDDACTPFGDGAQYTRCGSIAIVISLLKVQTKGVEVVLKDRGSGIHISVNYEVEISMYAHIGIPVLLFSYITLPRSVTSLVLSIKFK